MPGTDEKFLKRLLATFQTEAREHIQAIASTLVELEKTSDQSPKSGLLDSIFRAAHSLKGAARSVNLYEIETVCQGLENVFAALKRSELATSPALFDLLHQAVTTVSQLLQSIGATSADPSKSRVSELAASLRAAVSTESDAQEKTVADSPPSPVPPAPDARPEATPEQPALADTVRVATVKLDAVVRQAEELIAVKLSAHQRAARLDLLQSRPAHWKKKWAAVSAEARSLQQALSRKENGKDSLLPDGSLVRVAEFLDWNTEFMEALDAELHDLAKAAAHDQRASATMIDNLLDEMKKVVMLPFSALLDVFPRFVRKLSRDQGKEVDLLIRGSDLEMDRRVLEEMKDPLIHLIRNCLDHGIESPQTRLQQGKPARGTITISISPKDSNTLELFVSDDGAGIDPVKVSTAAARSGLLSQDQAQGLEKDQALPLIFQPGISTSPIITDISGRGLGLAIVKEKIEKLKGTVLLETALGRGTTFRISLPLTVARFRGVLVAVQGQHFVIPTSDVERVARIRKTEIKTVENRRTVALNGHTVSLVGLSDALGLPPGLPTREETETLPVVVLGSGNKRIAFLVDEVLAEQEVLAKNLGKQLVRVRNIAGATLLPTGRVAPILNVSDLLLSAVRASDSGAETPSTRTPEPDQEKKSVLVAEDSITSRTLLKSILETAGYQVETAVDGIDAFTKLRSGPFHAVVSDVDMPRMNGFGLTAKIRADKKLAELPVILVTALDSRSDREHGIDVGADAYIVKSSFDQSNLLDVIRRLI